MFLNKAHFIQIIVQTDKTKLRTWLKENHKHVNTHMLKENIIVSVCSMVEHISESELENAKVGQIVFLSLERSYSSDRELVPVKLMSTSTKPIKDKVCAHVVAVRDILVFFFRNMNMIAGASTNFAYFHYFQQSLVTGMTGWRDIGNISVKGGYYYNIPLDYLFQVNDVMSLENIVLGKSFNVLLPDRKQCQISFGDK